VSQLGGLDILVNNAGVTSPGNVESLPVLRTPVKVWDSIGHFLLFGLVPALVSQRWTAVGVKVERP